MGCRTALPGRPHPGPDRRRAAAGRGRGRRRRGARDAVLLTRLTQRLAVHLHDQLHSWIGGAIRRGIDAGEFTDCDVDELATLLMVLSDGFGIRLMLDDPRIDLASAQAAIWRAVAGTRGVPGTFPEI
ncbi:TetR family transcriptional regulator C-terminal domain-containing protein [Streptomyces lydicus]|uniref:TetR family transcriptional regulator C-terminal domain-containing protein n=1 Tax=Streptomyces lydicus TaxID=47763 RepID=UPI0037B659F3